MDVETIQITVVEGFARRVRAFGINSVHLLGLCIEVTTVRSMVYHEPATSRLVDTSVIARGENEP